MKAGKILAILTAAVCLSACSESASPAEETTSQTVSEAAAPSLPEGEYRQIGDCFRQYADSVVLMDGEVPLDVLEINSGRVLDGTGHAAFESCGIPPCFAVEESDGGTKTYRIYTAVDNKICRVRYVTGSGEIEPVTDPFLYGIPSESGFTVYLKEFGSITENGRYEFVFDPENISFCGTFYPYEQNETLENLYEAALDFELRLAAGAFETKYSSDSTDYFTEDFYNYSEITEAGYRTGSELAASLNKLYTAEKSEEIFEYLTAGEFPLFRDIDGKLFLQLIEGGGAYAWSFDTYLDVTRCDDDYIEADVIFLTRNDSDLFIPEKSKYKFTAVKGGDGWRAGQTVILSGH